MTAAVAVEAPRRVSSAQQRALATAGGSGTVARQIRVIEAGPDALVSTILSETAQPPAWVERTIQYEVPARDEAGRLKLDTLVRFAQVCGELPARTPKPYIGVGDDATLSAEWDIGRFHVAFQVGNDVTDDSIIFEVDGGEIEELPLTGNVRLLAVIMSQIVAGGQV